MPKAHSGDLRVQVIEMVQAGASRREAAEEFYVTGSSAVKWSWRPAAVRRAATAHLAIDPQPSGECAE
jgi:hypothetical protein